MNHIFKRSIVFLLAIVTILSLMPLTRADAAVMKHGSRGTEVRYLQQNLIGLGYLEDAADGSYGKKTRAAVERFQADFGMTVDGIAGNATQTAVRNAVVRLQVELKKLGYDPGGADGHFGTRTEKALKAFQGARGLKRTGVVCADTWDMINALCGGMNGGTGIRKGSSGTQVRYLQQALIGFGFLTGRADSIYGSKTEAAVRKFQASFGLDPDGSAGRLTMAVLKNAVVTLQSDLARKGFESGVINGVYGNGTTSAVKAYQRYVGQEQTGVAGPSTMKKLYGFSLGGSDLKVEEHHKIWIDSLYQDTDDSTFMYANRTKTKTVRKSGCGGVALAMALNALKDTRKYTGQNVMQWLSDKGHYYGEGTSIIGLQKYPRALDLNAILTASQLTLVSHLKQDHLAIALIKDRTKEQLFVSSDSSGHYVLISGYRIVGGVEQVYINNPLSTFKSGWFDLDDLMDNIILEKGKYAFSIIYK